MVKFRLAGRPAALALDRLAVNVTWAAETVTVVGFVRDETDMTMKRYI